MEMSSVCNISFDGKHNLTHNNDNTEFEVEIDKLLCYKPVKGNILDDSQCEHDINYVYTDHLFVSDHFGYFKQLSMKNETIVYDLGVIDTKTINIFCVSPDKQILFIVCNAGHVVEWSIKDRKIVEKYEKRHTNICQLLITSDGKY